MQVLPSPLSVSRKRLRAALPTEVARAQAGLTLIELLVSMTVLVIAVGFAVASVSSFAVLGGSAREKSQALLAAQQTVETMHATDFNLVFALFNDTAADDPAGMPIPGAAFDVPGLTPRPGDPDGRVGRILLPGDPAAPTTLREDRVDADFGLPRDLNADGVADDVDHAGDYAVLPVRVVVEWTSQSGGRSVQIQTILRNR